MREFLDKVIIDTTKDIHFASFTYGDLLLVLGVVFLIALVIGLEQEIQKKPGSNSLMLVVASGGALAGVIQRILIIEIANHGGTGFSPVVASGLLSGVGFLAAGVILKDEKLGKNKNITDAGIIWLVAVLGLIAGLGYWEVAMLFVGFITATLLIWRPIYQRYIRKFARKLLTDDSDER